MNFKRCIVLLALLALALAIPASNMLANDRQNDVQVICHNGMDIAVDASSVNRHFANHEDWTCDCETAAACESGCNPSACLASANCVGL